MSAPRVIHTAQALVDEVVDVAALPPRGGNAVASGHRRYPGGAVNILLAAARSGARAVHAGAHGTGPHGDLIRSALAAEGVALSAPPVPDLDTGVCIVLVEPSGERTFVTTQGAERLITVDSLATSRPAAADLICVSGYSLLGRTRDALLEWLDTLPSGAIVVLDPGAPFGDLPVEVIERVLARTDVWTGNADEARHLTARAGAGLATLPALVAERLPGPAVVIVRDGAAGCVVRQNDRDVVVPGFPQRAIDTNGAGDAHTGVLLASVAAGQPWAEAARRANVAGAIKVTRRGPGTAPTAAEIDDFLAAVAPMAGAPR